MPAIPLQPADPPALTGRFRLGHRPWLDGLRGIAVLLVLVHHLRLISGGAYGVDVFFVLSGFLITCLLVEEWSRTGRISLKRFYLRRALRLLPAFAVLLVGSYLLVLWLWPEREPNFRRSILVAACYLSNWPALHKTDLFVLGHTWSLAVEEQFYLLWPLLLIGLLWSGLARRVILGLVAGGIVVIAVHRALLFLDRPSPSSPDFHAVIGRIYTGLDTRGDALLVGCLVGLLASWNLLPTARWARTTLRITGIGSIAGLAYFFFHDFSQVVMFQGGFTVLAVLTGTLIASQLAAPTRIVTRVLSLAPLVGAGRISYALYLFHAPILMAYGVERVGRTFWFGNLVVASLSIGAAVVSYYAVERPFLRMKHRLGAAAKPAVPAAPAVATVRQAA